MLQLPGFLTVSNFFCMVGTRTVVLWVIEIHVQIHLATADSKPNTIMHCQFISYFNQTLLALLIPHPNFKLQWF